MDGTIAMHLEQDKLPVQSKGPSCVLAYLMQKKSTSRLQAVRQTLTNLRFTV